MWLKPSCLSFLFFSVHLSLSQSIRPSKRDYSSYNYYVLEQPSSPAVSLEDVAQQLEVSIVEPAGELKNHWLMRAPKPSPLIDVRHVGEPSLDPVLARLSQLHQRAQSTSIPVEQRDHSDARRIISSIRSLELQHLRRRTKRAPFPSLPETIKPKTAVPQDNSPDAPAETSAREVAQRFGFKDPLFASQWHLVNDDSPENTMNVVPVWEMGYTGKGVLSSLIDDGLDYEHSDLRDAFVADASHDFNDHEDLPTPKLIADSHGTRCAGQIAARTNGVCGVGIAYGSSVAGVRILSGDITDIDEAAALNFAYQNVSIYSCSWGPTDDGETLEAPNLLIKKALVEGTQNGRGGKGSIFVFASGNGAYTQDQCNFDGYTNSIFSITVSALDHLGQHPPYSEPCAANMIVTYSSGGSKSIVSTTKGSDRCTKRHGGTSAAAPNAVGVFALALEARPELSWRDMQYLCVHTARQINPDDADWDTTASGRPYSNKYGYGALDGYAFVKAAKEWNLVKPQSWLKTETVQLDDGKMGEDGVFHGGTFIGEGGVKSKIIITQDMVNNANFDALEHVTVTVWIQHGKRGDVEVELVSPRGIRSVLAQPRPNDKATTGFPGWTFMSIKHWGESPLGEWTIRVWDQNHTAEHNGTFLGWNMVLFGSVVDDAIINPWEVPVNDNLLPPGNSSTSSPDVQISPSTTSITQSLPSSHETSVLDSVSTPSLATAGTATTNSSPVLPSSTSSTVSFVSTMSYMVTNHPFVALLILAILIVCTCVGWWLWKRRHAYPRDLDSYISLAREPDHSMVHVSGSHVSLDLQSRRNTVDENDNVSSPLGLFPKDDLPSGSAFHDGFLDEPSPVYRDDPEPHYRPL